MKKMSNTTAIMIVAIGLFLIVSSVAIVIRLYEIGGTKKAPLFAGDLEEKIDFLGHNSLKEFMTNLGIEYGATTYLRNFSCEIGPHFKVERLNFSIDSLMSKENIRLFRYNRELGKTTVENMPKNIVVIRVHDSPEELEPEAEEEEGVRLTLEQFADALRFFLPVMGLEGPKQPTFLELKHFQTEEELRAFMLETGSSLFVRMDGQYQMNIEREGGGIFLFQQTLEGEEAKDGALYELEYY